MYLNTISLIDDKYITKMSKECSTYSYSYEFWKEHLLERVQRLFIWKGSHFEPNKDGKVLIPQKEIEMPLYLRGYVAICDYKKELTAFNGTMAGVTKYIDEFTDFNGFCPTGTIHRKIGEDCVIIDNTSLRNALMPLIHHYAVALGHTDVTLVDALINVRDCGGVPVATTQKQKQSIEEYQTKLYKGQFGCMTDIGNLGLTYVGGSRGTSQSIKDIYEVREKLLKSFYQSIGIKSSFEKNNNAVTDEVTSDTCLLQISIHDMLECRQRGAELVNNMFGTNWSVELAPEVLNVFELGGVSNENSTGNEE